MRSDRIFGLIGIAIAVLYAWQATTIQESFIQDPVGPKVFPWIVALVLGLSSLVFVLRPDPEPDWPKSGRYVELAVAAGVMIAYAMFLPQVGFLVATAFGAAFLSWRLGASPVSAIIAGIGISIVIYTVFHLILGLSLAKGPWGF